MPVGRGFRRFPPIPVSSRRVVNEISESLCGSNVQQFGSSSSAAVASERPVRRKVTKYERRALLESFVNKYRAMNSGKYPTAKTAQKEVGGCYYRLKRILQELEYNSKVASVDKELVKENKPSTAGEDAMNSDTTIEQSSEILEVSSSQITMDPQLCEDALPESVSNLDTSDSDTQFQLKEGLHLKRILQELEYNSKVASVDKELVKENKPSIAGEDAMNIDTTIEQSSEIEEVSSSQITMDPQLCEDGQPESVSNSDTSDSDTQFQLKEGLQTSTISEEIRNVDTHNVATETHDIAGKHLEVLRLHHQKLEQDLKRETQPEDKFEDVLKPKTEQHEQSVIENNRRDSSESLKDDELVLTEKPSIWQNLKSLANGFMNIWKKPQ